MTTSTLRISRQLNGVFVAGTDTGVGKSRVAVGLISALRALGVAAGGMKPVAAGTIERDGVLINEDAWNIAAASGALPELSLVNPCLYGAPASPHIAAEQEGKSVNVPLIVDNFRQLGVKFDYLVIEGAGGWRAPISRTLTMADVATALDLPVLLVVGLRLGCLNHAALSREAIARDGLPLAGWIANEIESDMRWRDENLAQLQRIFGRPALAVLPHDTSGAADCAPLAVAAAKLLASVPARRSGGDP